ncbi:unnamed protein product [Sphagnum balticum]
MACFAVALPPMTNQAAVVLQLKDQKKSKGFLDWLTEALDKSDIRETDAILKKVEPGKSSNNGAGVGKPSAGKAKGPAPAPQKKGKLPFFGK